MDTGGLQWLKGWFDTYVQGYYVADPAGREAYELKRDHSLEVAQNCLLIGASLNFDEQNSALAEIIGLFHDIGRFGQFRRYRTFSDGKSENHALLGATVLKENNTLAGLDEEEKRLVLAAVSCHNMLGLPPDVPPKQELFCRVIRDADKIDIMRVVCDYYKSGKKSDFIELNLPDTPGYTEKILDDLFAGRSVDMKKMKTLNDFKLLQLGWGYDLNFPLTARIISGRGYLEMIRATLPAEERIDLLLERLNRHLEGIAENGQRR